jgi:polysaccharide pyruvyl transferase WcaK-like protein
VKVLFIGDVGSISEFHVGDEAMLEAALYEVGVRTALDAVVVSSDPEETARRYAVASIPRVPVPEATSEYLKRLELILATAKGSVGLLASDDTAWGLIDAVAGSNGVVIAGGGNLSSTFRVQLHERHLVAMLAKVFSKPLVVTGQTLGPVLDADGGELLAEIGQAASIFGCRESASTDIARALGVDEQHLAHTVDDASFLGTQDPADSLGSAELIPTGYAIATFSDYPGTASSELWAQACAALVDQVIDETGLDVVLVPHVGDLTQTAERGDVAFHGHVKSLCRSQTNVRLAALMSPRQVIEVTTYASLVVSSRYHQVVFGLAAGVPSIGVAVDEYTHHKLSGALANFGLQQFALPSVAVVSGHAETVVREVWRNRDDIRAHLTGVGQIHRRNSSTWWECVAQVLTGELSGVPETAAIEPLDLLSSQSHGHLEQMSHFMIESARRESDFRMQMRHRSEEVDLTKAELTELRCLLAEQKASHEALESELIDASVALRNSQLLAAELASPIYRAMDRKTPSEQLIESVARRAKKSPTLRKSKTVRVAYSKARSISVFQDSAKR